MSTQVKTTSNLSLQISEIGGARLAAIVLAGTILFTVGFVQSAPLHNAAHDTRHVQVFPCH